MNKRQVIILWVIALALVAAVTAMKLSQKDDTKSATRRAPGQTLIESFPATDVSSVEIQGADGSVTLAKKDGGWAVAQRDDYPANASSVNEFLRTLAELKVTRGMQAGPSFAPRFGMDESASKADDRGLTATFKDSAGKEVAKISLGKNIESAAGNSPMGGGMSVGRYVRNHADDSGFYAINEMFPSISAEPQRWLDDSFLSPEKIKSISLSQKGKEEVAWKITRDTEEAEYKLEGAAGTEVLDTAATTPLKSLFSYARFEDVVPADKVAERSGDAAEKRSAVIETFEGFKYVITITPAKAKPAPPASIAADPETPAPATDNQLLTVAVTADLPKERKKEEGEKPEDAKTKDEAFTSRMKTLNEKLEKEKKLAGRTFEVSKFTVEALLKERDQLITKATPPTAADAGKGSVQQLPGGAVVTPPVGAGGKPTAATPPIEAVTPPIAVPPLDDGEEPAEEE